MDVTSKPCHFKAFALVRDSEGNPCFSDWFDIHPEIGKALTPKDWAYIEMKREEVSNGNNSLDSSP